MKIIDKLEMETYNYYLKIKKFNYFLNKIKKKSKIKYFIIKTFHILYLV